MRGSSRQISDLGHINVGKIAELHAAYVMRAAAIAD